MKSVLKVAAIAAAAVAVAAPAPASAAGSGAAAKAAAAARAANADLAVSVERGDTRAALAALKQSRRGAAAAGRVARRLAARGAHRSAARAERFAALTYDLNLDAYVALLGDAQAAVAEALAAALAPTINGRDAAIERLAALLDELTGSAQIVSANTIVDVATGAAGDAASLAEALALPGLPRDVRAIVAQAFAAANGAVTAALDQVGQILPMLPAVAQGPVESALDLVTSQLGMVEALLGSLLGGGIVPGARN